MTPATPILPKHQEFLDEHFSITPQWSAFQRNLRSSKFVEAVRQDPRTDPKLKRFAKMVGLRQQDRTPGVPAPGDGDKDYKIKYHPEVGRFSCSCPDWTYKRSVRNKGASGDCKHIKRMKESTMNKMASMGPIGAALRLGVAGKQEERNRERAQAFKIKDQAYKAHFPHQGLISSFLKKAAIRGAAARSLLEG